MMSDCSMQLYVKTSTGKTLCVDSNSSKTIAELKSSLSCPSGLPADRMILNFKGKTLEDSRTLESYGIKLEAMIELVVKEANPIQIFVKTETGKTLSVNILPTDSIAAAKSKISTAAGGVAPSQMSLSYKKRDLNDGDTVESAGLQKECVVGLVIKAPPPMKKTPYATKGSYSGNSSTPEIPSLSDTDKSQLFSTFAVQDEKPIEILFCFDTTGSMYSYLQSVRDNVASSVTTLLGKIPNMRIAICAIGDYCDCHTSYVLNSMDFSQSAEELSNFAKNVKASGGGDAPEAYELALRRARFDFSWTEGSSRALVMIGDAPPHHPNYTDQEVDWHDELDALVEMNVKLYAVECGNGYGKFYQELANRSGGFHLSLRNIRLVTDMFMAVCLREASPDKLKEFKEEVKERKNDNGSGKQSDIDTQALKMVEELEKPNVEKVVVDTEDEKLKRKTMYSDPWWNTTTQFGEHRQYTLTSHDEKKRLFIYDKTTKPQPRYTPSYKSTTTTTAPPRKTSPPKTTPSSTAKSSATSSRKPSLNKTDSSSGIGSRVMSFFF